MTAADSLDATQVHNKWILRARIIHPPLRQLTKIPRGGNPSAPLVLRSASDYVGKCRVGGI